MSGCSCSTSASRSAGGHARSELDHLPAVGLEEVADHAGAERVLLTRRTGDHREPSVAVGAREPPREPVEDRLRDRGRVVLLGDVERAHRPAVADLAQGRVEHRQVEVRTGTPSSSARSTTAAGTRGVPGQQGIEEVGAMLEQAHRARNITPDFWPVSAQRPWA